MKTHSVHADSQRCGNFYLMRALNQQAETLQLPRRQSEVGDASLAKL